jgi:hypothetical protein
MKETGSRLHVFAKARLLLVAIIAVLVAGFVTATALMVPGSQLPTLSSRGGAQVESPALPMSPDVLYDQYDNAATTGAADITSQDFEAAFNAFDNQAADDFVVPAGQTWQITGVDVLGEYGNGPGPADSFHVFFYANDAISNLPTGAPLASRLSSPYTGSSDFVITLTSPVTLLAGTYWVSVQVREDFNPNGQWFWRNRTVQSNSGAAWQNPGNGFGTGCTTWIRRTGCAGLGQTFPDQVFRLHGKATVVPPLTDFRDVRRAPDINPGFDLCGTGNLAMNFTGSTGSAGDTWITVYDATPADDTVKNIYGSVSLSADVQIRRFNNRKGAGLLALFNEGASDKGLALIIYDNGNTDGLTLGTVSKSSGQVTALTNVFLDSGIAECAWYRLTMDVVVSGGNVTVTGKVFQHTVASDPNSSLGAQVGGTLSFSGALPAGVSATGEVGIPASAISAVVDSSVTNFTIDP